MEMFRMEDQFNDTLMDNIECGDTLEIKAGTFAMVTKIAEDVEFKVLIVLEKGDKKEIIADKILDGILLEPALVEIAPDIYSYVLDKYVK